MNPWQRWTIFFLVLLTACVVPSTPTVSAEEGPRTPAQELASFHLADAALTIELIASEPDIVSPVAIAWDADGRMFVAEMLDYPNSPTNGQVKLLEDRDGDGRYERVTVFADKLPFPNGVLPWNGGVLITAAPNIWFMKDTDGDGRADEKRVVLTGFGEGNQQLRVNGLLWGLDNWVYGANGRSDGMIRRPDDPQSKAVSLAGHDFRFRPDTGEFELLAGRSQFGCARDDWGNRFLSWNTIPIRHEVIAERYLKRSPVLDAGAGIADLLPAEDTGRVFPLTPPPLVFNNESPSYFNALAGLTIYRGEALGETYRGNAFMGEALRNLVHRRVLVPNGVTFVAERGEKDSEFLASTDPWFHPVNFATGPDGALYVVDFYRQFVEHPNYVHGEGVADKIAWRTGAEHGRIWRIRQNGFKLRTPPPKFGQLKSSELVSHMANRNGWWRDTAQRLLIERKDTSALPALRALAKTSPFPLPRIHSLWTLDGMNAMSNDVLFAALKSTNAHVLEHVLRIAEPKLRNDRRLQEEIVAHKRAFRKPRMLPPTGPLRAQLQFILTIGAADEDLREAAFPFFTLFWQPDRWETAAALSSMADRPWAFFRELLIDQNPPRFEGPVAPLEEGLAELIGASQNDADIEDFLVWLARLFIAEKSPFDDIPDFSARIRDLARFAEGLRKANRSLSSFLNSPPKSLADQAEALRRSIGSAGFAIVLAKKSKKMLLVPAVSKADETVDRATFLSTRIAAIKLLGETNPSDATTFLYPLLRREEPLELLSAVVKSIANLNDASSCSLVFTNWSRFDKATQRILLTEGLRSVKMLSAFLEAIESQKIDRSEVDAITRQQLLKTQHPDLKRRVEQLFKDPPATDRDQVVRSYLPALQLQGDRQRGAAFFAKTCVACHALQGKGKQVGPDLSGAGTHPKETLLLDILDPSRQISPDYASYTVVMTNGESLTGLVTTQSSNRLTVRAAGAVDETIVRSQIKEMSADSKSLMPDGLEQGMTHQDMADLLEFLRDPDSKLLPEEK